MHLVVSIEGELADFVKSKLASGNFSSSEDVVSEALRLMKELDQAGAEKLHWLQQAWCEGVESGDAGEIDFAALKAEARERLTSSKA